MHDIFKLSSTYLHFYDLADTIKLSPVRSLSNLGLILQRITILTKFKENDTVIEETIKIHDKYQFEIKLGYQLAEDKKTTAYDIETYLFFPNSLGINPHTYEKDAFYNDIQTYIRLKTPTILLKDIVTGKGSPLEKLRVSVDRLVSQVKETTISYYEYQIKMFCCIFKSAIRDHVSFILTKKNIADIESLLVKYLESIQEITQRFRELRSNINLPIIDKKLFSIYLFGDEYISLLIESYTYELLEYMKHIKLTEKEVYTNKLLALITTELELRKKNHYPSIPDTRSTNEVFIFRAGVLKKYIGNVLFLNTRVKQEGHFLEQIVFALAAGLSMVFATSAVFFAQSTYTRLSLPVFIIFVVSYMFKDRIKELTRLHLGSSLHHFLFDHKMSIYYRPKDKLGSCKESFTFIKERKIPKHIIKLRNKDHITEIENGWLGEKTILYKKRIKLFCRKIEHIYLDYRVESINDILRLNVSKFLRKMDNPQKSLYLHDEYDYRKIYGERVYHMNMIIKYSMKNIALYKRFRIVLSQDGIKRIENVVSDEEHTN